MANVARRRQSRRRLAALAFLSNISLDGTHRDTLLGVLNLNFQPPKRCDAVKEDKDVRAEVDTRFKNGYTYTRRLTIAECTDRKTTEKKGSCSSCEEKAENNLPEGRGGSFSKGRERVQKFVLDTKAKLYTLNQKRKQLVHQRSTSDSLKLPSGFSTESLTYGPQSRKSSINFELPISKEFLETARQKVVREYGESERLVLVSSKKVPFAVFSYIPFNRHSISRGDAKPESTRRRHNSTVRQLTAISDGPDPLDILALLGIERPEDGQDISFGHFLMSTNGPRRCRSYGPDVEHSSTSSVAHHFHASGCISFDQAVSAKSHAADANPSLPPSEKSGPEIQETAATCRYRCHTVSVPYNANLLDDPELIAGKHCTLLAFPSYVTSVINYVKPEDLKKDLNDKFREKFPHISLTLSKLRSLKKEMVRIARHECNLDLAVVAHAFVYFEKLILKMLVNKQNRKLCAGACLLLSAKLNDVKGGELRCLLEKIESVFRVSRKDLICLEFRVLVALEFSLHLPLWDVFPHYQRLVYTS